MRPFYKRYGSKWQMAKYYGRPRRDLVIEPFAGSAGYSTYWRCPNVKLYDIEHDIVELWDYLIHCSTRDIELLPDWIESPQDVLNLPLNAEQTLIKHWLSFGAEIKLKPDSSLATYTKHKEQYRDGKDIPWESGNAASETAMWSPSVKRRILRQKPLIANWSIELRDYTDIPNVEAHWHIDPPYQSQMKVYNRDHSIDYSHLSGWSKSRKGVVDVCEQTGADWLPFEPLKRNVNFKRNLYTEVFWSSDNLGRLI